MTTYRWELYDGPTGENLGEVYPSRDSNPTLTHDTTRTIKRQISSVLFDPANASIINTIRHRIRLSMIDANNTVYPLGRYVFSDDTRFVSTGGERLSTNLADEMFIIDQKIEYGFAVTNKINSDGNVARLETVTNAIRRLLSDFDVTFSIEPSPFGSLGAWPPGTNRGQILDTLAIDGDYFTPWFDHNGKLTFIRSFNPYDKIPDFDWDAKSVVIRDSGVKTNELIRMPNRITIISNSFNQASIYATYDIPVSAPHSIFNRGFVVPDVREMQVDNIAQAEAIAQNIAQREMIAERIEVSTVPNPLHDSHNVIRWLGSNWLELGWSLPLSPGGEMRHSLRRAYT